MSDTGINYDTHENDYDAEDLEPTSVEQYPLHDHNLPVHEAAYKVEISVLTSLVAFTKNINVRNRCQCTAVHMAIPGNREVAVRILMSAGANPALEDEIEPGNMLSFDALQLAAYVT
jgi:hypothetical protein